MDLSRLATLKEKLLKAKRFEEVTTYFFDHFGDDPAFMGLGEATSDGFLEAVLEQVAAQLFGRRVPVGGLRLLRLPEHGFIHGGFHVEGKLGNLIYFEDVRRGLIAIPWSLSPPETKYARFSGQPLPSDWSASRN
jgi:hypothetical protein